MMWHKEACKPQASCARHTHEAHKRAGIRRLTHQRRLENVAKANETHEAHNIEGGRVSMANSKYHEQIYQWNGGDKVECKATKPAKRHGNSQ
eukprot:363328-Chlamydomonas_euryale.AAC.8